MRIESKARRHLMFAMAVLVAVLGLTATSAASVMAETPLHDTGVHGMYEITDTNGSPAGRCGYGAADSHGVASLNWVRVQPPGAWARDVSGNRDHQTVQWRIRVQRSTSTSGPWVTGGTSSWEQARAYDDAPAMFNRKTFHYTTSANQYVRAIIQIQWLRGGSSEGSVTLSIDWYAVHWTVGNPDYVFAGSCTSRAD